MTDFSRIFPFIGRFFPPRGPGIITPGEVTDAVHLVHEMFRGDTKHGVNLVHTTALNVAPGGGVDIQQGILFEPGIGMVRIPLICAVSTSDTVNQLAHLEVNVTGNAEPNTTGIQEIWGANRYLTVLVPAATVAGGPTFIVVPAFPCPRGNSIIINWIAPPGGASLRARSWSVQVPLECVDWVTLVASQTSFLRNVPI